MISIKHGDFSHHAGQLQKTNGVTTSQSTEETELGCGRKSDERF